VDITAVNERRWLALIFGLYFVFAAGYSLLMPIWEAPDEAAHFHLAWYLARKGRFPTETHNYEANQPRAYYYLASFMIRGLDKIDPHYSDYFLPKEYKQNFRVPERRFDWSDANYRFLLGVYALRWLNILVGAAALWLNRKAFRRLVPDQPELQIAALGLAALTPQYLHIMSSVSNDAAGALGGALLFYLATALTGAAVGFSSWFSVALAVIVPLITKLTVLPVGLALIITAGWQRFAEFRQKRIVVASILVIAAILLAAYFLFQDATRAAASEVFWRLFTLRTGALTPKYLWFILNQIVWSYWGKVGWLAVGLPGWSVIVLTTFAILGIAIKTRDLILDKFLRRSPSPWTVTWLIALFTLAAVIRNGLTTSASQGRFLFPAIGALSLLMIGGWHSALPERLQRHLPLIVVIVLACSTLYLWGFEILPTYYQPFLD
jgi:hypothetical protein